ncbi:hypothetical protein ABS735_25590 [Streptomyces sp. MMCC 100]|uniref:hypothetical protein n=1 Tax=Streptomyces sp. MMCC 100 TaxID=3163555 RepID=UPI003594D0C4
MSTTPSDRSGVDLRPARRISPRRLGAAAVVYGVFVAGWYLGQPVTPECRPDQTALDRLAEQYGHVPVSTPTPTPSPVSGPTRKPSVVPQDGLLEDTRTVHTLTVTSYAATCTSDTGERPRLRAWSDGDWR